MKPSRKVTFFVTEDWYFCSHRLPLALAAKKAGYQVSVVTRVRSHENQIVAAGIKLIPLELSRRGLNPLREIQVIYKLFSIYCEEQPDIVHNVALKPVLYGSVAAYFAKIPHVVSAMAGLGFLFSSMSLKARGVRPFLLLIFRLLLKRPNSYIILQNPDDLEVLSRNHAVNREQVKLIRGSGVDLLEFKVESEPDSPPLVILASRLLWDKGVGEFVESARILKKQGVSACFALVGEGDDENPSAISDDQLRVWKQEGVVEIWGRKENMPRVFAGSHIVCLPSAYGEGVPKVLIEAAACGRPIVTTDAPGCREIVVDGVNGILVPLHDANAVAKALNKLICSPELRKKMGGRGRALVEKEFSLGKVNSETLALYAKLCDK